MLSAQNRSFLYHNYIGYTAPLIFIISITSAEVRSKPRDFSTDFSVIDSLPWGLRFVGYVSCFVFVKWRKWCLLMIVARLSLKKK